MWRRVCVIGWRWPSGSSSPGQVTSTWSPASARSSSARSSSARRWSSCSSSRPRRVLRVMPLSRSRTARSACARSLLRPRKRTRASSSSARFSAPAIALCASIASLYDPWSRSVTEDVSFYVEEARRAGGPVVELAVGTGRIAIPTAAQGIRVIGIDSSPGMLEICRRRAELAGVSELLELRLGELEEPPVDERVRLVTCPFRSFLHLLDDDARLRALRAARQLLVPGGRLVFDVFAPAADDIANTHGRWLERESGIFERA